MKLSQHIAASLPLGLTVGLATGAAGYALVAVLASILIDLDHIPDYIFARRGWRGVKDFFATCYRGEMDTALFALHAWEWPILLGGGFVLGLVPPWLALIGVGFAYHLVFDLICNRPPASGFYWFTFRASKRFSVDRLFCPERRSYGG